MLKPGETTVVSSSLGFRDAFHMAAVAVCAMRPLDPGDLIIIRNGTQAFPANGETPHAIVDPWLNSRGVVEPGEIFLAFPMPGTTSNLRHVFDTPFDSKQEPSIVEGDEGWSEEDDDDGCRGCYN